MPKYFLNPFAINGDKESIPDASDPNGFVSYDTGYGYDYERDPDPLIDPLTKDIERDKMNQIFFDITENIKFMQDSGGVPEWSAARVAVAGYPRDAKVVYAGITYTSTVNNNVSTPGSSATWILGGQTDPTIISISALTPQANQMIYFTGQDQAAVTAITSFGRSVLAANDAAAGRVVLGVNPATTTAAGLVEWATDGEVNSGAAPNKAVESRQLHLGRNAILSSTGGVKLPSWLWGLVFNWGSLTIANDSNSFVTWPIPCTGGAGSGVFQFFGNFGSGGNNQNSGLFFETTSGTQGRIYHNGSNNPRVVRWWSVGRSV